MKFCGETTWIVLAIVMVAVLRLSAQCEQSEVRILNLLPYPKEITRSEGVLKLGPADYVIPHPSATTAVASGALDRYLPSSGPRISVRLGSSEEGYDAGWLAEAENAFLNDPATSTDAYILKIGKSGITVVGKGKWGMLYGVQTLNQATRGTETSKGLWRMKTSLPYLTIKDWPDMRWRCLSPQITWYSGWNRLEGYDNGNWTLDEWKWLVDWSLLHKCNAWALCICGYWPFTLPGYEESTLDVASFFFDPATGQKTPHRFVHRNIKQEFLPELIRYAQARGVKMYAYMGINSFAGGYQLHHPEVNAGGAAEMMPFAPGVHQYNKAFLRRLVDMGFDGFVFENPEANHVPYQNEDCYKTFWEPFGYTREQAAQLTDNAPLAAHVEYNAWLAREYDGIIQERWRELGRPGFMDIYLISHVLLSRVMSEGKTPEERAKLLATIDTKVGRPLPFITVEADEKKYAELLGPDRTANLGGRGGACTCAMHRIASVNNCWVDGPMGAGIDWERDCQTRAFHAGQFGAMGYIFEWTNTEIFGYIASQYLWRNAGVPGINNEDQAGFLDYAYRSHYGEAVGALVARAMDEGSCINDAMVLEGVYGMQYPSTGAPLHRDYQYLAALADHALDLATRAYKLYTGHDPDLRHPVYKQDDFRWNGFDQQANKTFNAERLRLLCVSAKRSQEMCETALAHRLALRLAAEKAPASAVLEQLDRAISHAKANQLLYQVNYDDDYDWTDGLCTRVTERLQAMRDQYAANGSLGDSTTPLFIPWEKQTEILPSKGGRREPGLYLVTDVGLTGADDYYCLGVVFTAQIQEDDGSWRTVFRHAVNRRSTGWDHYEIPLSGIVGSKPKLRMRFLTDSYSRAQNRGAPSWKWALWGMTQLVRLEKGGQRSVVYDFTSRVDECHPFVRLDSDGADRPFDGSGQDSTGATFRALSPPLVENLRHGEGRGWQWVEGFDKAQVAHAMQTGRYPSYLGTALSWWGRADENGEVAWLTAPAPKSKETAVVFIAGTDYSPGQAELWCNGQRILGFDTGRTADAVWQENGVELRYLFGGDTRDSRTPYGLSGTFLLRLPASRITAGQPLSLSIKMISGGHAWFMLHGFRNILQMKRGIAAYTPHLGGAFGITGADYDVDVVVNPKGQ